MLRRMVLFAVATLVLLNAQSAEAKRRSALSGNVYTQGGYPDRPSVVQGGSIGLHISSNVPNFHVRVINLAEPEVTLRTITGLQAGSRDCGGREDEGCEWDRTTTLDVPRSWPSGYYAAVFPTHFGERYLPFIVREDTPGSTSNVVVLASTHTWQAYNSFGSRSTHPRQVSYDRPYFAERGLGRYTFERPFVNWMKSTGRTFEVISDLDLEDPTILSRYDVLVIPGQSAYWTATARATVDEFSRTGGHIAALSGNTMWWQIRLENSNRIIASYEGEPGVDPGANTPLFSTHFFSHPTNKPENRLLGTSFRNGGFVNRINDKSNQMKPVNERTPWTVREGDHWVFAGTNLRDGDLFGQETTGLEVDGVVFNCGANGQILGPDGSDEAPLHYQILATVPASEGWGTMGLLVHQSGGAVFNAATSNWVPALDSNETVRRITANVLDRFSTGVPLTYQPSQSTILAQDLFNCPQPIPATGWESTSMQTRVSATQSCAYEGPAGLELSGDAVKAIVRYIAPRGGEASRSDAHLRFYIKADELQQRTTFPMAIVGLDERVGDTFRRAAFVEVDATSGKQIRVARRSTAGAFSASPWIPLGNGWHLIEVTWRSPGTMTLQVDGGNAVSLDVADADQRVNRVVLAWPAPELTTAGRVCIDAFAVGSTKPGAVAPTTP